MGQLPQAKASTARGGCSGSAQPYLECLRGQRDHSFAGQPGWRLQAGTMGREGGRKKKEKKGE